MSEHRERGGHNLKPAVWLAVLGVSTIVAGGMAGYKTGEVISDVGHLFAGAAMDRWEEGIFANQNSAIMIFSLSTALLLFLAIGTVRMKSTMKFDPIYQRNYSDLYE